MGGRLFLALAVVEGLFVLMVSCAMVAGESLQDAKPYVVFIPILILADYYLTILYAWLARKVNPRIDVTRVELNPMWKADVATRRLINVRHLIHVAFMTCMMLILSQAPNGFPRGFFHVLFGFVIGMNASLVAEHCHHLITLLAYWRRGALHPVATEGAKLRFVSARSCLLLLLLSATVALSVWLLVGGILGQLAQFGIRLNLERQARSDPNIGNQQLMYH